MWSLCTVELNGCLLFVTNGVSWLHAETTLCGWQPAGTLGRHGCPGYQVSASWVRRHSFLMSGNVKPQLRQSLSLACCRAPGQCPAAEAGASPQDRATPQDPGRPSVIVCPRHRAEAFSDRIPGVAVSLPGHAGWVQCKFTSLCCCAYKLFVGAPELCARCAGATHLGEVCLPTRPAVLSRQGVVVLTHHVAAGRVGRLAGSGTLER